MSRKALESALILIEQAGAQGGACAVAPSVTGIFINWQAEN